MTSSPGCHITTRWPVARTVPDSSMPGISCASHAGLGYSPMRWSRSARLSAVAHDVDQHLLRPHRRLVDLLEGQDLGTTVGVQDDGAHAPLLAGAGWSRPPTSARAGSPGVPCARSAPWRHVRPRAGHALGPSGHLGLEALVERVEELLGGQPRLVLQMRMARSFVIWPDSTVSTQTSSSVLANAVTSGVPSSLPRWARPPGPGEDRRDRVGRGLLAPLVLAVVAGDGAVGGLGLDGLAVGRHQHPRHQARASRSPGRRCRTARRRRSSCTPTRSRPPT